MFGMFVSTVAHARARGGQHAVQRVCPGGVQQLVFRVEAPEISLQPADAGLRQKHKGLDSLYDVTLSYQIGTFEKNADDFTYEGRWHFPGYQEPSLAIHVNDRRTKGVCGGLRLPYVAVLRPGGRVIHAHFMNIIRDALCARHAAVYAGFDVGRRIRARVYQFNATETMFPKGKRWRICGENPMRRWIRRRRRSSAAVNP